MGLAITKGLLAAEGGAYGPRITLKAGAVFIIAVPAEARYGCARRGRSVTRPCRFS